MYKERSENFVFPPSVQSDLFSYLKPEQKGIIKPVLRILKNPAQEELCCALLDYLEKGEILAPADDVLAGIFYYCTQRLTPLHRTEPKTVGTILKQMFNHNTPEL